MPLDVRATLSERRQESRCRKYYSLAFDLIPAMADPKRLPSGYSVTWQACVGREPGRPGCTFFRLPSHRISYALLIGIILA